jgi:hypothetical protein
LKFKIIFRLISSSLFERIITSLDSKDDVARKKKKLLNNKMRNINKSNTIVNSNSLPIEYKNYLAYEKASQKIQEHEKAKMQEKEEAALERVKEIGKIISHF